MFEKIESKKDRHIYEMQYTVDKIGVCDECHIRGELTYMGGGYFCLECCEVLHEVYAVKQYYEGE
jgi:hypothetical protein